MLYLHDLKLTIEIRQGSGMAAVASTTLTLVVIDDARTFADATVLDGVIRIASPPTPRIPSPTVVAASLSTLSAMD